MKNTTDKFRVAICGIISQLQTCGDGVLRQINGVWTYKVGYASIWQREWMETHKVRDVFQDIGSARKHFTNHVRAAMDAGLALRIEKAEQTIFLTAYRPYDIHVLDMDTGTWGLSQILDFPFGGALFTLSASVDDEPALMIDVRHWLEKFTGFPGLMAYVVQVPEGLALYIKHKPVRPELMDLYKMLFQLWQADREAAQPHLNEYRTLVQCGDRLDEMSRLMNEFNELLTNDGAENG